MKRGLVAAAALLTLPNTAAAAIIDQAALVAELQRQIAAQQAQIDAQAKAIAELRGLVIGKSGPASTAAIAVPVVAAAESEPAAPVSAPSRTSDHIVRVGNADVILGGAFTLNTLVSSRRTVGPAGSVFYLAPPDVTGRDNVLDMTAQYSRISLGIDIPAGDDWTVSARTMFTFYNGSLFNASYGFQPLFGYGSANNGRWTFSAGLMFELFSPRQPDVVDSVSALYFSGNPANSPRAQLRAEWRAPVASGTQVEAALALTDPISTFVSKDLTDRTEDNGIPNVETRLAVTHAPDGWSSLLDRAMWEVGLSAVYGEFRKFYNLTPPYDVRTNQARGISVDAGVSLSPRVALQGEVWTGQALGNYGAAIGASVNPVTRREVHASGGWGEVALAWSDTAHSTFGYGFDRPNRDQLVPGDKARNETLWGNVFWRAAPWLQLGLEGTWRRTQYLLPADGLLSNDGFGMLMTTSFRY
ncbi:MAG: hypothetical protein ACOYLS_00215 [Polymorphobacter sp.]